MGSMNQTVPTVIVKECGCTSKRRVCSARKEGLAPAKARA